MKTDLDVLSARCWLPHAIQVHPVGYLGRPVDLDSVDFVAGFDRERRWGQDCVVGWVLVDLDLVGLAHLVDLVEVSVADRRHNQVAYTASNGQ